MAFIVQDITVQLVVETTIVANLHTTVLALIIRTF